MRIFLIMFFSLMMFVLNASTVVVKPTVLNLNYDTIDVYMSIECNTPINGVTNIDGKINIRTLSYVILEPKENFIFSSNYTVAVESANIGYIIDSFDQIPNNYRGYTFGDINILDRNVA